MVHRFHYLKHALAAVLIFIGSKIFIADLMGREKFPPAVSLAITFGLLEAGTAWSLLKTCRAGSAVSKHPGMSTLTAH